MKRIKIVIGIILLFCAGALTGSVATGIYFKHRISVFIRGEAPPTELVLKKLSSELDLTQNQRLQIEAILKNTRYQLKMFRKIHRPKLFQIISNTHYQIRSVLNPRQQIHLDALFHRFNKRFGFDKFLQIDKDAGITNLDAPVLKKQLKSQLHLTETQEKQVYPILISDIEQRIHIYGTYKDQSERLRQDMEKQIRLQQSHVEDVLIQYLTDEQIAAYKELTWNLLPEFHPLP